MSKGWLREIKLARLPGTPSPGYRATGCPGLPSYAMRSLDRERWWQEHPTRDDLEAFFISHLTSVAATEAPLIVLGQPGPRPCPRLVAGG